MNLYYLYYELGIDEFVGCNKTNKQKNKKPQLFQTMVHPASVAMTAALTTP